MKNQYIKFSIEHQVIQRTDSFFVVGGSVNYLKARFSFCDDWSDEEQIAIFTGGGHSYAVTLTNGECVVPWEVLRLKKFYVSCMAGERITSNAVSVKVCPSGIGDELQKYLDPTPTVFDEKIKNAVEQYMKDNPVEDDPTGQVDYTDATAQYNEYLNSGGTHTNFFPTLGDGKYCVDDGFRVYRCKNIEYCGCLYSTVKSYGDDQIFTEELFIDGVKVYEMESSPTEYPHTALRIIGDPFDDNYAVNKKYVDNSIPKALPNPHALTFTGAASGSYDGSKPLAVNIPQGGGSDEWELIGEFTLPEDSIEWWVTEDADGNPIELKEALIILTAQPATLNSGITNLYFGNPAVAKPFNTNCYFATANCLRNVETTAKVVAKYIPNWTANSGAVLSAQDTSSVAWGFGDDIAGGTVNKKCLAGVAMKSSKPTTDLIGANSKLVLWGVRI